MRTKEQMREDWIAQREEKGMFTEAIREKYTETQEASELERIEAMLFAISTQLDMLLEVIAMEAQNDAN